MMSECPFIGANCPCSKVIKLPVITPFGTKQYNVCEQCPANPKNLLSDVIACDPTKLLELFPQEQAEDLKCGQCGLTVSEFTQTGKLGCAQCYKHFHSLLAGTIIPQAHAGQTTHVGKKPKVGFRIEDITQSKLNLDDVLESLTTKLDLAVKEERYENAATLRDLIKQVKDVTK